MLRAPVPVVPAIVTNPRVLVRQYDKGVFIRGGDRGEVVLLVDAQRQSVPSGEDPSRLPELLDRLCWDSKVDEWGGRVVTPLQAQRRLTVPLADSVVGN